MTIDLKQLLTGVVLTKACSIKADKDSLVTKTIYLEVDYNDATIEDAIWKSMNPTVIQWQNGPGRGKFEEWTDGQTVKVKFKSPGRTTVDPEVAIRAKMANMTQEEKEAYIAELIGN